MIRYTITLSIVLISLISCKKEIESYPKPASIGVVSSAGLKKGRRYAIVGIAAFAAIATPPDPMSQIMLGSAIYLLYEISIISVGLIEKKRDDQDAEAA